MRIKTDFRQIWELEGLLIARAVSMPWLFVKNKEVIHGGALERFLWTVCLYNQAHGILRSCKVLLNVVACVNTGVEKGISLNVYVSQIQKVIIHPHTISRIIRPSR